MFANRRYKVTALLLLLVAALLIRTLIVQQIVPLMHDFSNLPTAPRAAQAIVTRTMQAISLIALLFFFVLIGLAKAVRHSQPGTVGTVRAWGAGFGVTVLLVVSITLLVDPRNLYGLTRYPQNHYIVEARALRLDLYAQQPAVPQVLVLGSSRSFPISPRYIQQRLGYTAFNATFEGGTPEDYVVMARYIIDRDHALPPVLLAEVTPGARYTPFFVSRWPLRLLPSMPSHVRTAVLEERLNWLVNLQHVSESFFVAAYSSQHGILENEWMFDEEGYLARPTVTEQQVRALLNAAITRQPAIHCTDIDKGWAGAVNDLVALAAKYHSAVIFFTPPFHPQYYAEVMQTDLEYQRCHAALETLMQDLIQEHNHVYFLDYTHAQTMNGLDTAEGFFDYQHMAYHTADRLIDAAAATITTAYTQAGR